MAEDKISKMTRDTTSPGNEQVDCARAADEPTVVHGLPQPPHVSDVVLADPATDVKLADSMSASDIALAEGATGAAPSFRAPSPLPPAPPPAKTVEHRPVDRKPAAGRGQAPMALLPGAKVDDFEIVKLLGRGAFGHVYLARQITLDRHVALKISANRGSEGRTMARLEHQHIVQVFSETVDVDFDQRLLCMQLVPGIGLEKLIGMISAKQAAKREDAAKREEGARSEEQRSSERQQAPASSIETPLPCPEPQVPEWTGAELLDFIDFSGSLPTALDTSALHDREALGKMDAVEATAWFGTRLALALDFAHRHGVLHRDIKPANILVNPYGRPMLADFNISSQPLGSDSGDEMFGGTFAYMSPEHLDAFNPGDSTGHEAVNERSDLYSLGLVLKQLLAGRIAFPPIDRKVKMADTLRTMADERRRESPICAPGLPGARMTLERSIGRCLEPKPEERFASGADLAAQLDGCRHLREAELKLPRVQGTAKRILTHPFLWLVILVILPQLLASAVNITYNAAQIGGRLSDAQTAKFKLLVGVYNAIIYPIAVVVFVVGVRRVWKVWNALSNAERIPEEEVQDARRRALKLPRIIAGLAALGWFPGGVIFPLTIMLGTPDHLELDLAAHFVVSFWMSGLIAMAYSLCGVEFVVLRVLYPGLWRDVHNFTQTARKELAPVHRQLNRIEVLAVIIPLLATIVFVMFGDTTGIFAVMVASLNLLGIFGFYFTTAIANNLSRVLVALTNTKE